MTISSESSFLRARRMLLVVAALLTTVIVVALLFFWPPKPRQGAQAPSVDSIVIELAAQDGWEQLVPMAGDLRVGFPPPMVQWADHVCVGFGRVDFAADELRPSLARCEEHRAAEMATNEVRVLVSVQSGFDTWHFIEAADRLDSIDVWLVSDERVDGDRVFMLGTIGALRLENGRDLASIEWSTPSSRYRCISDPAAWRTSVFCADGGQIGANLLRLGWS